VRADAPPSLALDGHPASRGLAAPGDEAGLFSVEWWAACVGVLAITLVGGAGDLAIGVYLVCCATTFARNIRASSRALMRFSPLLAFPAFALFSTLWSEAPDVTGKQALELLFYFATIIVISRPIRLIHMAAALQIGTFVCCLLCLAVQPSALHGSPLYGLLGSKNQVSFVAQLLLLSSMAVALDAEMPRLLRLHSIAALALAVLEIRLAQSAGGLLSSVAAVSAFVGLLLIGRLRLPLRAAVAIGSLLTVSPLLFVANDVVEQVQDFQMKVLHKDATLTGRTELWTFARSLIAERPVLGHGFAAFWRQGNMDAEGLWQEFAIDARAGYNFHNQFIETQVELGLVGLIILISTLIYIGVPSMWRAIRRPSLGNALATSVLIALYVKLPVESVLIGSWSIFNLVFVMAGIKALGGESFGEQGFGVHQRTDGWRQRGTTGAQAAATAPHSGWRRAG
jgi:exopolysaccharide production protein ExoQ